MVDKKQLIIKEAVNLFATKGYHTTSVQEIAERCHIAKGSFYNYFKSKEELLLSCFKSGFDMSAAVICTHMPTASPGGGDLMMPARRDTSDPSSPICTSSAAG